MRRGVLLLALAGVVAVSVAAAAFMGAVGPSGAKASSHREAPLIADDPAVDNTDLYAFVSPDKPDTVTIIANYIPFEDPAGGPNYYRFDPTARYEIHIDNDGDARDDVTYRFRFKTTVSNPNTFLYNTGPITFQNDPDLNVKQTYSIEKITRIGSTETASGQVLRVAPPNIGPRSNPVYNTTKGISNLGGNRLVFAGPRDDPFFVDLGSPSLRPQDLRPSRVRSQIRRSRGRRAASRRPASPGSRRRFVLDPATPVFSPSSALPTSSAGARRQIPPTCRARRRHCARPCGYMRENPTRSSGSARSRSSDTSSGRPSRTVARRGCCCRARGGPTVSSATRSSSSDATTRRSRPSSGWFTLRPGLSSYARVAYARELTGDPIGALAAMRRALDSAAGQPEPAAFALVEIAKLELGLGRLDAAARHARVALRVLPGYPAARLEAARIETARGRIGRALAEAQRAAEAIPTQVAVSLYAELLDRAGRYAGARRQRATIAVIDRLLEANGVRVDLESAVYRADYRIQPAKTVQLARQARAARPSIYGDDALAWALARAGRCDEALPLAERALRLGTKDPLLYFHRGYAEGCAGNRDAMREWYERALALNPEFSVRWAPGARAAVR